MNKIIKNNITIIKPMVDGKTPIPDHYHIGNDCNRNHGINGKTIRNKRGQCIGCEIVNKRKKNEAKKEKRPLSALHKYEEMQEKEHDEWDYEL